MENEANRYHDNIANGSNGDGLAGSLEPRGRWARSQRCGSRSAKFLYGLPEYIWCGAIDGQRIILGGCRLRWGVGERAHHMGNGITDADFTGRRRVACRAVTFPDGRETVGVNRRRSRV